MSWLTGQRGCNTYICIDCRFVSKSNDEYMYERSITQNTFTCPKCSTSLLNMGKRWRPPKKTNDKAWRKIANGDYWWDVKVINEPEFIAGVKGRKNRWIGGWRERNSSSNRKHITKFVDRQRDGMETRST